MANQIPPEGDEYNARRTEDLHAAIANKAHLSRRFYEMVRAGAPEAEINTAIDAMAFIEREIPHISKDLAVSVQGRNLDYFLKQMQEALKENADANTAVLAAVNSNLTLITLSVEQVLANFTKVGKDVAVLKKGQSTFAAQMVAIKLQLEKGEKENAALAEKLDTYIAGNKREQLTQVAQDVAELKERLARLERDGDDSQ